MSVDFYCPHCAVIGSYDGDPPFWWPNCPNCQSDERSTVLVVVGTPLPLSSADRWAHHVVTPFTYRGDRPERQIRR